MKRALLVTSGFFHPPLLAGLALHKALKRTDGWAFRRASSLERLPADLDGYQVMVLYFHQQQISEQALKTFARFVSSGGGVLAIHSVTASFKDALLFSEIVGGRFVGHGALGALEIRPTEGEGDGPFRGIGAFTVTDELYLHDLQEGTRVRFMARRGGEEAPAVWTYRYGQGRVCYAMPGHCTASMKHAVYQQILRTGLDWACRS